MPPSQPNVPLFVGLVVAAAVAVVGVGVWVWFAFLAPYPVDEATFPDAAVRTVVSSTVDSDGNGEVSRDEAGRVTEFAVDGATNLDGVGRFPNLRTIAVKGAALSSADLAPFGSLESFEAPDSGLAELDVSRNPALSTLDVPDSTQVTGLETTQLVETWLPVAIVEGGVGDSGEMAKGTSYELERDSHGNPLKLVKAYYSDGYPSSTYTTEYSYDDAGRIVGSKEQYHSSYSEDSTTTCTYGYDEAGRLKTYVVDRGNGPHTIEYGYDDAGRLTTMTSISDSGSNSVTPFEYDDQGRVVAIPTGDGCATRRWFYDDEGQLAGFAMAYGDAFTLTNQMFVFDDQGDVVSVELTPGDFTMPEWRQYGMPDFHMTVDYAYGENGRLASGTFYGHEQVGMDNTFSCEYDGAGRLSRIDYTSTMRSSDETTTSHGQWEQTFERCFITKDDQRDKTVICIEPTYYENLIDVYTTDPVLPYVPDLEARYRTAEYQAS